MKVGKKHCLFLAILFVFTSCQESLVVVSEKEDWLLGWRMVENSWDENHALADLQFDSLLSSGHPLELIFLTTGIETKLALLKEEEVNQIISDQPKNIQRKICENDVAIELSPCLHQPKEVIQNKELQYEIMALFVDDQAVRGNRMEDIIQKFEIDTASITTFDMGTTDEINRDRLKEIIAEYGFPTRKLIGREAMRGLFFIIQHADGDRDWQESQLAFIKEAVERGELKRNNYTYLYDRIQVNKGEEQLYGTQFAKVNRTMGTSELQPVKDIESLDDRRRAHGMMPIALYRKLIIRE